MKNAWLLVILLLMAISTCAITPPASYRLTPTPKQGVHKKLNFSDFNSVIHKIKEGMHQDQVLEILGDPGKRTDTIWQYGNFPDQRQPVAGETLFYGATITFANKVITDINLSWIDVTGPAHP